jgi:hypothetical protein
VKPLHGWWPRFSEYEFVDGKIRAARGAKLERYDPWEEYEAGKGRGEPPPYVELLNLLSEIRPHTRHEYRPDEIDSILRWTVRHGLLGVLHEHRIIAGPDVDQSILGKFVLVGPRCREVERVVSKGLRKRSYGGWGLDYPIENNHSTPRGSYAICDPPDDDSYFSDQFLVDLTEEAFNDEGRRSTSDAVASTQGVIGLGDLAGMEAVDDDELVPEDIRSDEFWGQYCEPVEYWFGEVFAFAEAAYGSEIFRLDSMISKIRLTFVNQKGKPTLQHSFDSLIGAMALMYAQDQITGYRLVKCVGCGCEMVTSAYQARYCSRTCGDRDRKRKSRAAAKARAAHKRHKAKSTHLTTKRKVI